MLDRVCRRRVLSLMIDVSVSVNVNVNVVDDDDDDEYSDYKGDNADSSSDINSMITFK